MTEPTLANVFDASRQLHQSAVEAGLIDDNTQPIVMIGTTRNEPAPNGRVGWRVRATDHQGWGQDTFLDQITWGTSEEEVLRTIQAVTATIAAYSTMLAQLHDR